MSETEPTSDELAYLAGLDVVRSDGFDRTSPALARMVLHERKERALDRAAFDDLVKNLELQRDDARFDYRRARAAALEEASAAADRMALIARGEVAKWMAYGVREAATMAGVILQVAEELAAAIRAKAEA